MYAPLLCFYTVVILGQMRKSSEYWEASGAVSQDIDWLGFLPGGGKTDAELYGVLCFRINLERRLITVMFQEV